MQTVNKSLLWKFEYISLYPLTHAEPAMPTFTLFSRQLCQISYCEKIEKHMPLNFRGFEKLNLGFCGGASMEAMTNTLG